MLVMKYERRNFFGNREYTEDKKGSYCRDDLKRAFLFFGKNHDSAIQVDNAVITWDSLADYENRVATVRKYDGMGYEESKVGFDKVKKDCYAVIG